MWLGDRRATTSRGPRNFSWTALGWCAGRISPKTCACGHAPKKCWPPRATFRSSSQLLCPLVTGGPYSGSATRRTDRRGIPRAKNALGMTDFRFLEGKTPHAKTACGGTCGFSASCEACTPVGLGESGPSFVDNVEGRLRGPTETAKTRRGDHIAHFAFARLRAETQADFLRAGAGRTQQG